MTENIEQRIATHNSGKVSSTKGHRPWKIVLIEKYDTREQARTRELYFKSGLGREFLKSLGQ